MRTPLAPLHLLLLAEPFAHHLVDCRFHKARADPFPVAVALTIIGDFCTTPLMPSSA
jgi:hypothetical protein